MVRSGDLYLSKDWLVHADRTRLWDRLKEAEMDRYGVGCRVVRHAEPVGPHQARILRLEKRAAN